MAITGGERIARMLAEEGVEVVFGIIDGTYFGLYGHLSEYGIRLVSPRHETSAVHMAGAYARLTGRLGVAIASNGPGVANALPGVAVENGEGNRVLLLTSWRRHQLVDPDRGGTFQYFDQPAVIAPMAKWSTAVPSFDRIGELMRRALRLCWRGRPGVVHVTVPEDIMNSAFDEPALSDVPPARYRRTTPVEPAPELVDQAARLLVDADAPVIHAGSGVLHARATAELRQVAEMLVAPVTTSWSGRDVLDERLDVALPMLYPDLVDRARTEADVVLAIGSRFSETRLVGHGAPLAAAGRAAAGPGRQRRRAARHEQAGRHRRARRRPGVPPSAGRPPRCGRLRGAAAGAVGGPAQTPGRAEASS